MTETVAAIAERALRRLGVAIVPAADRPTLTELVSQATIATNALVELGVIASDETPSAADQALAAAKVAAVHDALVAQALVSWAADAVPRAVAEEYTKIAAMMMASSFGKAVDPSLLAMLEGRVRKVALVLAAPDVAIDSVLRVHRDLVERGLARWTAFDVPDGVASQYATLAAADLAPQFAERVDPRDTRAAEVAILRYVALPTSGEHVRTEYF